MKQISALINGFATIIGVSATVISFAAAVPALAEDFTAGKTPAQLFRSDCGACHASPNGLVKQRSDLSGLTAFLREHYTTKSESAAALAAYVAGLASPGGRNRGPAAPGRARRSQLDSDVPMTAAEAPADIKPADDTSGGRRASGDSVKRRARDDGDAPRPPRGVGRAGSKPATGAASPVAGQQEGADPIARLRSYLSSGLDSENASAQSARNGAPKAARRRHPGGDDADTAAPANADTPPAAAAEPSPRSSAPADVAPSQP